MCDLGGMSDFPLHCSLVRHWSPQADTRNSPAHKIITTIWMGSKDRRIRHPLDSFSPISWSFIAPNGSLLDLGAHLGKAGSGLVLWLQRGSSQAEDKDEVMSQRMQYYTKRPYYQPLNPIIQSQSPLCDIHCSMYLPAVSASWALCATSHWSLSQSVLSMHFYTMHLLYNTCRIYNSLSLCQ